MEYKTDKQKRTFYKSNDWRGKYGLRLAALERDNYECQECKRLGYVHADSIKEKDKHKSIELNVHHIKEIEDHPELALELDNLETLCLFHHNKIHGRVFGKSKNKKWDDERW